MKLWLQYGVASANTRFKIISNLLNQVTLFKVLAPQGTMIYYQMKSLEQLILTLEAKGKITTDDIKSWEDELSDTDYLVDRLLEAN